MAAMQNEFSTVAFCVSSPTGFVELADAVAHQSDLFLTMHAEEIERHPHARFLSPVQGAGAWLRED